MKLETWVKSNGVSVTNLATLIGVSGYRTAQRYITGERIPRPEVMEKIHEITEGQVTANDFYASTPKAAE